MKRFTLLIGSLLLAGPTPTVADSFSSRPYLEAEGVDVLNRTVSRQWVDRDLLSHPYDTAVLGHVDVYDRFPYVESRWFQVVSDAHWNRLLIGEIGGDLRAHDGAGTPLGALDAPRGVAVDEYGTLYVADSGNHRVMVYDSWTEFGAIELTPRTAIEGFGRPYDVAVSDGGTPFVPGDDRLYVADTGTNRVVAYAIGNDRFELRAEIGELGSGPGRFAGPFAIAVGRSDGVHTRDVYVADAHNGRIVHLVDRGDRFEWTADSRHEAGLVTSLDTDHWGHVYAAAPASGTLVKLTPDLKPLARVETGLERPRAFHVPFARRTDHRTGEVSRAGQGAGVLVEDWTDATGLRVLRLDTDVTHLRVAAEDDVRADFLLTDRSGVALDIVDDAGRTVRSLDAGVMPAGEATVRFAGGDLAALPAGDYSVRVTAESGYEGSAGATAQGRFAWNGSSLAALDRATLLGGQPNPFRASTTVGFALPHAAPAHSLAVYDISGRLVRDLSSGPVSGGSHAVTWNGRDDAGRDVAAGIYFVQLSVGKFVDTRKVVHLR